MLKVFLSLLPFFIADITLFAQQLKIENNYFDKIFPDTSALLFAEGIISSKDYEHSSPAFSASHGEIYWSVRIGGEYGKEIIKFIKKENEAWSQPETASFSEMGKGDLYPVFSADGSEIYFTTDRSAPNSADSINRFIWKVKKNGRTWSAPEIVGFDSLDIYGLSVSSAGSLYFMAEETEERGSGKYNIYFSRLEDNKYTQPAKLLYPVSTEYYEDCPFISYDEKILIFESNRPGGFGKTDLYISTRNKDGKWSEPANLGKLINSESSERFPYISPDGKYFFFGSDRTGNMDIYWISTSVINYD